VQETPFKRHEPLYLKYRPQSLSQLVGQEGVFRTLVNAIDNNRLSHAYLFTGPRGTGKTSSARILAKSLNCKTAGRPTVEPCQTCSCCVEITQGNSPAVFEIDAASNNSVDDARVLIERAPLVAVGGDYKVYIIDECHMLTKEAFNALLKTIEQPPPKVVFILATTEEHKVLPTIISRCQRLMFKLINQDALGKHLRYVADSDGIEIEDEALELIARRSGGGLRDALSNLDQASLLAAPGQPATVGDLLRLLGALHEDVLLDLSRQIAERSGQAVIDSVGRFLDEGREPQVVLQELARHFLNLMKASYLSADKKIESNALNSIVLGSGSYLSGLIQQTELFERAELSQIIEQIDRLEQTCRRSSQPAMHLEIGLLSICHRHDIHLVKDLLQRIQRLEEHAAAGGPVAAPQARPQHQYAAPVQQQATAPPPRPAAAAPAAYAQPESSGYGQAAARTAAQAAPAHQGSAEISSIAMTAAAPAPAFVAESHTAERTEPARTTAAPPPAARPAPAAKAAPAAAPDLDDESDDPHIKSLNADIEYFWQQVLDELQRRHLPTYSLTSTHAFPLRIGSREVSIGVMKENFQKMLESKVDHLRVACQAISGRDLAIRIRVVSEATAAPKKPQASPQAQPNSQNQNYAESRSAAAATPSIAQSFPSEETAPVSERRETPQQNPAGSNTDGEKQEFDATMVKEAYKLFEGPGSRQIN